MQMPSLTIADGETKSNALDRTTLQFLDSLSILPPSSLSGTVTVRVADIDAAAAVDADYRDLESGGSVVTVTAGQALVLTEISGHGALRLETDSAPGADEVYDLTAQEQVIKLG